MGKLTGGLVDRLNSEDIYERLRVDVIETDTVT